MKGDQHARLQLLGAYLAHAEHRGRLREETACTWRPHRRSASGFLHVGEKVGELINWWESPKGEAGAPWRPEDNIARTKTRTQGDGDSGDDLDLEHEDELPGQGLEG